MNISGSVRLAAAVFALSTFSVSIQAQESEDMEKRMEQMAEIQECMKQIDQGALQQVAERGQQIAAEAEALCAAGKRDEAQSKAMSYGKEMESSPVVNQMRECGMTVKVKYSGSSGAQPEHVCDAIQ